MRPGFPQDDEHLITAINALMKAGSYASAVEYQEELLLRLMEYEDRDGDDRWEIRMGYEFRRMDHLLDQAAQAGSGSASSSSQANSSSAAPGPSASQEPAIAYPQT